MIWTNVVTKIDTVRTNQLAIRSPDLTFSIGVKEKETSMQNLNTYNSGTETFHLAFESAVAGAIATTAD